MSASTRSNGDRFGDEEWQRLQWKNSTDPGGPFGATMPLLFASREMTLLSSEYLRSAVRFEIHDGLSRYSAGISSFAGTSMTPSLCEPGMSSSGPLNSVTSS